MYLYHGQSSDLVFQVRGLYVLVPRTVFGLAFQVGSRQTGNWDEE